MDAPRFDDGTEPVRTGMIEICCKPGFDARKIVSPEVLAMFLKKGMRVVIVQRNPAPDEDDNTGDSVRDGGFR